MRFAMGPERVEFAGAVRRALADGCPPAVIRDAWEGKPLDRAVWQTMVDMGTTDPDLDHLTRVAVAEEVGRAALPHPWMETAFVVGPVVGERLGALMATTDLGTPGRFPCGADADVLLVADGRLVEAADATHDTITTVDRGRRMTRMNVHSGDVIEIGSASQLAGTLGTAAVLVGLAQHLLDTTVAYVSERHQFGQPVGGFQAVKHHLADAAKDLAFARHMVHRAAHGLDRAGIDGADPGAAVDVSTAKALASDAATLTAEVALQCHGAIGYTVEYDLHLWLKRVWALTRSWGDAAHHRYLVGEKLGLT